MAVAAPTAGRRAALVLFLVGIVANTVSMLVALGTYGRAGSFLATPFGEIAGFFFPTSLLAAGYLLRSRRPANAIGRLFLAFGIVATISAIGWTVMLVEYLPTGDPRMGAIISWVELVLSVPTWSYLLVALVLRFPDGTPSTAGEARLLRWFPVQCVVVAIFVALRPGPLFIYNAFDNPLAMPESVRGTLTVLSSLAAVSLLVPFAVASAGMVRRYRAAATKVARLQLRWFAFAAGIVLVASALYLVLGVVVEGTNAFVREATYALFVLSLTSLPVAVFQAVATHRLYDIDRIIGRTFAYGALTAILAGLYSASIRLFNWLFVDLTGQDTEAALVLTTLILATSFTPIKTWLEKGAAKRFKFDAAPAAAIDGGTSDGPAPAQVTFSTEQQAFIDARIEAAVRRALAHPPERPRRR